MSKNNLNIFEWTLVTTGALAFISSFLPWFTVSEHVGSSLLPELSYNGSQSANGWTTGIGAWGPILLMIAVGVLVIVGRNTAITGTRYRLYAILAGLAAVVILIRWATLPSAPVGYEQYMSMGPGFGLFLGLFAAVVAIAATYLANRSRTSLASAEESAESAG